MEVEIADEKQQDLFALLHNFHHLRSLLLFHVYMPPLISFCSLMTALERSINTEVIVGQRAGEAGPEEILKPGRSGGGPFTIRVARVTKLGEFKGVIRGSFRSSPVGL